MTALEDELARLRCQLDTLTVRADLRDLLDGYFRGFDEGRTDDQWLRTIFAEDVSVTFPGGAHNGFAGPGTLHRQIMRRWQSTLHLTSNHLVTLDRDVATVHATLAATHIHRAEDPGAHLHIGGHVEGHAIRLPDGWRFRQLTIRLTWTQGDPPAMPDPNRAF